MKVSVVKILKVDIVLLVDLIYKRIGLKHHTVNELMELVKNDQAVWNIYANGYTMGVNQVEKESTTRKSMKYKPRNVSELSAFIAAIRPAFKSMYSKFENREDFSYGIPAFDKILQTEELPQSFILYQEQTMNTLNYAGFPIDECYGIIKAIAKKHPEKVKPLKERFITGFKDKIMQDDGISADKAEEDAARVWQIISDSCGYGFNCVSGSTKMKKSGRNCKFEPTVEEMYRIMNDKTFAEQTGHKSLYKKYHQFGYGYALSMFDDQRIYQNKIIGIYPSGVRETFEVQTKTGKSIICTNNHRFPTPSGKKRLDELRIGDLLYCMGEYEVNISDTSLTDGNFERNYPCVGECGFRNMPDGASAIFKSEKQRHMMNFDVCESCGRRYSVDGNFELHHIDHDRHNNNFDNFMWLCNSCHKKTHYKSGRNGRYQKGIPTYLDEIVSITSHGFEQTYDVEMDDPAHTFISENGLVTSNSAHAYCMALDSLYNAYLKAHYPYEFYEVLLQTYSDKGKKDKVAELKQEMSKAFGIKEGEYKFGLDNRKFKADPDNQIIYPSLLSIKGLSQGCANDLYAMGQKKYENFYELWKDMKKKKNLDSGKVNTLIEIGYFDDFGTIGKIKRFIDILDQLYDRSQFSKANLPVEFLPIIRKYSEETDKQYRKFDYDAALTEIWENLEDIDIPFNERLKYELQNIGYIKTLVPDMSPDYAFVQEYECKYKNPKLTLYRLFDGSTETVKIRRKKYDEAPINVGDIIKTIECSEEGRWSKYNNGDWQQDNSDKESILKKWSFVRDEAKEDE